MPARWQVLLDGPPGADVPIGAPHAVVSGWLDDPDRTPGMEARPHHAPVKRYSVAPPTSAGRHTMIEVRVLDDALGQRLCDRLPPQTPVRLGGPANRFAVACPPRRTATTGWVDLLAWDGQRAWDVALLTPATVRNRNRTSPLLSPRSVLIGLGTRFPVERWPPDLPRDAAELASTVWVSDLDGETVVTDRAGHTVAGFRGRIRYRCDGSERQAAAVHALLRTATYSGIGSHTAWGFGVAHVRAISRHRPVS